MSDQVIITGKTYPVSTILKGWGGKWDAARKGWIVDRAKWEAKKNMDCGRTFAGCYAATITSAANNICPTCGGYCQGDCQA